MLRSALNASVTGLFNVSTSHYARCVRRCIYQHWKLASSSLHRRSPLGAGRMADVLDILGPLDSIFPPSAARLYVGLLRRCIKSGNATMGSMAHARLVKSGLGADPLVSNVLLNVYSKAGHLDGCAKVFDDMPLKDMTSWCTLISGYVSHGFELEAFGVLKSIHGSGLKPNQFILSSVLKGCANSENMELGIQVHTAIIKSGLMFDSFVGVGLVSMYGKFGAIVHAHKLFYEIPVKCLASWNSMISGYVQNGLFAEAVELSRDMCRMGFIMDLVTLRILANAVSALAMLSFCRNLHAYSMKIGLDTDNFVVAEYVKLLANVGEVDDISKLFKRVRKPDACLFSLTISGYYVNGFRSEAVEQAEKLFRADLNLNLGVAVSVLNLCLFREEGRQIHAYFLKSGHETYLSVGNALISMYINCGSIEDAKKTFAVMPVLDIVSWTAIISGHVQYGQFGEAVKVFQSCWKTGMGLDQYTIATILNAFAGFQTIDKGKQAHALALKLGVEFCDFLSASLLHMYAKCGDINSTTKLFLSTPSPHGLVPVNVVLSGYCRNSLPEQAIQLFHIEYLAGFIPDEFSFSTILGACTDLRSLMTGQQLHSRIIKSGFELSDIVVGNAIINLYVKAGNIESACRSFYDMNRWDSGSYAMLILGYVQSNRSKLALKLFCQMHRNGLRANPITFTSILRGCTSLAALELGKQVHASILKRGFVSDGCIVNSLGGMYAKSGDMDGAAKILNEIQARDGTQSNSVITGYIGEDNQGKAYKMFELMRLEAIVKEQFGYMELLKIGIKPSDLMQGISASSYVVQDDLKWDYSVGNTLFVMYSGYVFLKQLQGVFRKMKITVDTSTYDESGHASKSAKSLKMIKSEKDKRVHILFLSTCTYDLVKGELLCVNTRNHSQKSSTIESHYCSLVKILRQAVVLDENLEIMSPILIKTSSYVHQGFLATCQSYRNVDSQAKKKVNSAAHSLLMD